MIVSRLAPPSAMTRAVELSSWFAATLGTDARASAVLAGAAATSGNRDQVADAYGAVGQAISADPASLALVTSAAIASGSVDEGVYHYGWLLNVLHTDTRVSAILASAAARAGSARHVSQLFREAFAKTNLSEASAAYLAGAAVDLGSLKLARERATSFSSSLGTDARTGALLASASARSGNALELFSEAKTLAEVDDTTAAHLTLAATRLT